MEYEHQQKREREKENERKRSSDFLSEGKEVKKEGIFKTSLKGRTRQDGERKSGRNQDEQRCS